ILFRKSYEGRGAILGCRIRASTLRKRLILNAGSPQQPGEAVISLDAPRLVINSVLLIALLGELLLYGPWSRPYRLIFDGHDVHERSWSGPRRAFNQMQVLP